MMKRGVSTAIGWVLLIGFAVTLSVIVYSWSRGQVEEIAATTSEEIEGGMACEEVNVALLNVQRVDGNLELNVSNTGYLTVSELVIRAYDADDKPINTSKKSLNIMPRDSAIASLADSGIKRVEVIPIVNLDGGRGICEEKVVTRRV